MVGAHQDVVIIEDDYVGAIAGAPYVAVHTPAALAQETAGEGSAPWVVIRSLSKVLGPDLRVALMAGDTLTVSRVEGRQLLGAGWVSHLLQQTAANIWASPATKELLARTERVYAERRAALIDALAGCGITAYGGTGLGVWVPLAGQHETDEHDTVQQLLERGWAVSPGQRYRFHVSPAIRITTTTLNPAQAPELAAAINDIMRGSAATYTG
jgi:DNA-binding transcriptional MocR family regulator